MVTIKRSIVEMIAWNLVEWASIVVWSVLIMVPVFLLLKKFDLLRVTEEIELKGKKGGLCRWEEICRS